MTKFVLPIQEVKPEHAALVGGKTVALARLTNLELNVPKALVITVKAYHEFVEAAGLKNMIRRELTWRPVEKMRWEEMWDASLRIRNAFLKATMPIRLRRSITAVLRDTFEGASVAVRSSAPGEDSTAQSFAGLHQSYLNIRAPEEILKHIQLVWASLWSDGAILYRKELGLDVEESAMAVLVQEFVTGSRSGVAFSQHPLRTDCVAIEAVHGLNQGLVDGMVEPDRWTLDRGTGEVLEFRPAERSNCVALASSGVKLHPLAPSRAQRPPLSERDVTRVYRAVSHLESIFARPQDMEWTCSGSRLFLLQSRAITTTKSPDTDNRTWYLTLRRSLASLQELRDRIEGDFIPLMEAEARKWKSADVSSFSDRALLRELDTRFDRDRDWVDRYWKECIPFAHGVRLFGQFYNDAMGPEDPYEFVRLLMDGALLSVKRNDELEHLAGQVRTDVVLRTALEKLDFKQVPRAFLGAIDEFACEIAEKADSAAHRDGGRKSVAFLLLEMARRPAVGRPQSAHGMKDIERAFLARFQGAERKEAKEMLELARVSYRMRDDDNIYLGRIARLVGVVRDEAVLRKLKVPKRIAGGMAMRPTGGQRHATGPKSDSQGGFAVKGRQLPGQPGGPGFSSGVARIVAGQDDLLGFKSGEVLVCDALDPNMTFVLPLVSAIVECRGGMLVHGAIIAREYGIPCVTGVSDALSMISTGDRVQVDGYLGLVTIG